MVQQWMIPAKNLSSSLSFSFFLFIFFSSLPLFFLVACVSVSLNIQHGHLLMEVAAIRPFLKQKFLSPPLFQTTSISFIANIQYVCLTTTLFRYSSTVLTHSIVSQRSEYSNCDRLRRVPVACIRPYRSHNYQLFQDGN